MKIINDDLFEKIKEIHPQIAQLIIEYENKPFILTARYISKGKRYEILKRQKWNCNQCACKLKYSINNPWEGETAHIDHIHPFSAKESYIHGKQNINELENLQALCPKCNLSKGKKEIH